MKARTIEEILENANKKLLDAETLMQGIEDRQRVMVDHLHTLLHHVGQLKAELDVWRHRAEDLEKERNQWESQAGEWKEKWRLVAKRAVELAVLTGEARCPECGSASIALIKGGFPTGVTSPDGGREVWYECALDCQECGHVEEMV